MTIPEKAELTALIRHFERSTKSGMPIYNSKVPSTAGRKPRRRKQAIAKRYTFHVNARETRRTQAITMHYAFHADTKIGKT